MARGALTAKALVLVALLAAVALLSLTSGSSGQLPAPAATAVTPPPPLPAASGTISDTNIQISLRILDERQQQVLKRLTRIEEVTFPAIQADILSLKLWRAATIAVMTTVQFFLTLFLGWYLKRPPNGRSPAPVRDMVEPTQKRNQFFGMARK